MPRIRNPASNALLAALAIPLLLAGCAGMDPSDARSRAPLADLGYSAAEAVLEAPDWPGPGTDRVIRVAPVEMEADFGPAAAERYSDALIRGLLSAPDGPQVLPTPTARKTPANGARTLPRNHWRLTSRLNAPLGPITLSDRRLYPYTLTLGLYRAGGATPWWQTRLEGALDGRGLSTGPETGRTSGPASGSGATSATPTTDAP